MQSLGESERLFYKVREKPYNDSPAKGYILQEYVAQDNGMAKQGDILCTGTMEKCRELLRKMETGELTQGDVKELYAKEQEEQPATEPGTLYDLAIGEQTDKELNLINMGRDYLKLYGKYDDKAAVILRDINRESGFAHMFAENVEAGNKESIDAIIYNLTAIRRVSTERKRYKEAEECERLLFLLKEYNKNKILKEDIRMDTNIENAVKEQEGKEFVTVTVAASKIRPFKGKDGKEYCSIDAGQGYSYVRPTEQLRESVKIAETIYFSVPEDYDFTLKRSRSDGQGGFVTEELKVTVNELKERHKKYDDTPDFVKISISAKRVVSSFTSTKSGEPVEYCKIMAPEGMTYIRKKEQSATFFQNKAVRLIIKNSLLSVNLGENFYIDICKTKDI